MPTRGRPTLPGADAIAMIARGHVQRTSHPTAPASFPPPPRRPSGGTFSAFRSRDFTALWLNTFSFFLTQGTQRFTFVWLILNLDDRSTAAGLVSFALGIPVFFFALPSGILADRVDRRLLLVVSQVFAIGVSAATAFLIWSDAITPLSTFILAAGIGLTMALGQPVRQAILPSIVPRERLMNAVVLTSLGQNVSTLIGPAIGGAVIALSGIGGAFAMQGIVYGVGLVALVFLHVPPVRQQLTRTNPLRDLREGFAFVVGHRGVLVLLLLLVATGIFMMGPSQALIPKIAREELGKGAFETSLLFTALGTGMLSTSLLLATLGDIPYKGGGFLGALIVGGIVFAGIGLSQTYILTLAFMFAWGLGGGFFINLNQTLVQTHTPADIMGRVMSIHTLAFFGVGPMGSLLAGWMADSIGAPEWVAISGFTISAIAVFTLFTQPSLRRMR